jgi:type III pantothenate kinase
MIGGLALTSGKNLCMVNCGTAVTVDFVSGNGNHLGGVICPGIYAQQEKVVENAAAVELDLSHPASVAWFSTTTRQAILSGAVHGIAGLVRTAYEDLCKVADGQWQLLVTGGGGATIMPLLPEVARFVPDLLLSGLASVALQRL